MMKFLRSQSQAVLIIILGVIGLGFIFYGSSGTLIAPSTNSGNDFGRVNGENLSIAELSAAVRNTRYAFIMRGQAERITGPQIAEQAWGQLLLLSEADRLNINITDKELETYIRNQPIFQQDGVFSVSLYQTRLGQLQYMLHIQPDTAPGHNPLSTTAIAVETVLKNELRCNAVSAALFSPVRGSAKDVAAQYEKFYGPTEITYVTLDPKSYIDTAQVTPQEIENEYKEHPTNPAYRSPEKRKVDYVLFQLTPEQAKLPAAEKKAAMEAIGKKALAFALAFQPDPAVPGAAAPAAPDFLTEANKRELHPATTDFFSTETTPAGVPPSPSFNNAAFELTKDNKISSLVELDNGIAVIHLVEIKPSDLLPLDQVKPVIVKQLQQSKGQLAAQMANVKYGKDLKDAVAKGVDFKTAAAGMKLKTDTISKFIPMKASSTDQKQQALAYVATTLAPGEVSDALPMQSDPSSVIVFVSSRAKADPAGLADFEKRFRERQDEQLRSMVYSDWVTWMGKQPGYHKPAELAAFGSIQ